MTREFDMYDTAISSLFHKDVCNVPVSFKANKVGNQFGVWCCTVT